MSNEEMRQILKEKGLKVTPQRIAIMESFHHFRQHPTAEQVISFIRNHHPNIATGTVYKTLETFVHKGILNRVKTDRDIMRYDPIIEPHHHLYDADSERIEDYFDEELNLVLDRYFQQKNIPGFNIQEIVLQIRGKFNQEF
jgi:Fur family peroxide stress response transcriptional regulator